MIATRLRRRTTAAPLSLSAVLATTAATAPATAAPARTAARAAASACPRFDDSGACPVDRTTKTEILNGCESNPSYQPWH
ncbi:hypothetical protein ACWCRF_30440 [Streptomyces sp. NPDC002405]|uniref:hypothetical protein n=1 Tax=unclassified Streptomyces TaxID=2593676 RepID=UPI00369CD6E0